MAKDNYTKDWIISNAVEIIERYDKGVLTLRGLHYQLVSIGMTNDLNHYKRVVNAMIAARWSGIVPFDTFSDLDRAMVGKTEAYETVLEEEIETGKNAIKNWMEYYTKNRWENQPKYVEVLIEKKALQGVFSSVCSNLRVGLGACKGYPSLTFLYEMSQRLLPFIDRDKKLVVIYFGDYDPSGEDIPRAIEENLQRMDVTIELKRIALMEHQVVEMGLPPAPAKLTDTRTKNWDGLGQVELDAVRPEILQEMCRKAIMDEFDTELYSALKHEQLQERKVYKEAMVEFVKSL